MDATTLMGRLGPFQNRREMLTADQSTGDIIDAILEAHRRHAIFLMRDQGEQQREKFLIFLKTMCAM
jgi:hypothetical protein